ncbi:hypothetical protein BKA93DRAFT_820525 [Sparassis latifolia]
MLMTLAWHANLKLNILAIYAPNDTQANQQFWSDLNTTWDTHDFQTPDILLGDLNIVEDSLDRLPRHTDPSPVVLEPHDLKDRFQLYDGWHQLHPTSRAFSFLQQGTGSQSRIDQDSAVSTDHSLISVCITDRHTPFIGKGRWTLPLSILSNEKFLKDIDELGCCLQHNIANCIRTQSRNPQTLFKTFKNKLLTKARKYARTNISKSKSLIDRMPLKQKSQELTGHR